MYAGWPGWRRYSGDSVPHGRLTSLLKLAQYSTHGGETWYSCISMTTTNTFLYPLTHVVMEWVELELSSVSTLSWRDSRRRVWWTFFRLSNQLVFREQDLSKVLYVISFPFVLLPCQTHSFFVFRGSMFIAMKCWLTL